MGTTAKTAIYLAYYLAYGVLYLGFVFHLSPKPEIGPFTRLHLALLVLVGFGFFLPPVGRRLVQRHGLGRILVWASPGVALTLCLYLLSSQVYYYTRAHPFDPFLQISPPISTPAKQRASSFRIVAIGGSTTRNRWLPENSRYPQVLQEVMEVRFPDRSVEVINAGMEWYTSKHSLIQYATRIREWQPDVIVVMHAINDLYRSFSDPEFSNGPYDPSWAHYYGPAIRGARPETFEQFFLNRLGERWYSRFRYRERNLPLDRYVSVYDFRRYLQSLAEIALRDGVQVLLMTQPYLYHENMSETSMSILKFGRNVCKTTVAPIIYEYPSPQSLRLAMDAYNAATREIALLTGAGLIDLEPVIKKDLAHFIDDVHYTADGAREVAETVAAAIVPD